MCPWLNTTVLTFIVSSKIGVLFVIVIDHFKNRLHIFRHDIENRSNETPPMAELVALISNKRVPQYSFKTLGDEQSNVTDSEYIDMVNRGKQHCFRGDVFQIVLSKILKSLFPL